jgi:penicillin-binding protein 1C
MPEEPEIHLYKIHESRDEDEGKDEYIQPFRPRSLPAGQPEEKSAAPDAESIEEGPSLDTRPVDVSLLPDAAPSEDASSTGGSVALSPDALPVADVWSELLPDDAPSEDGASSEDNASSEDDVDTGELPGVLGEPTIAMERMPTGATPTAELPRAIPRQLPVDRTPPRPRTGTKRIEKSSLPVAPRPPARAAVPREPSRSVPPPGRAGYVPPRSSWPAGKWEEKPSRQPRNWGRIMVNIIFVAVVIVVLVFVLSLGGLLIGYASVAAQLPAPEELRNRQTTFVSSKILDREGNLLYEVTDPQGGRRTYVDLDKISPYLINATVATEDRDFWYHPGFDPVAILRAIYYNLSEGEIVSGASTIPQQLARNVLMTPEERVQQTAERKIKEAILAAELSRTYTKEEILEIYLNEAYYGNIAYGIQAASETYFGVDAADLTLGQASFLAGLPQSPATYDPFGGGRDAALARQQAVLGLMVEDGYISEAEAALAAAEIRDYEFRAPKIDLSVAPHFVVYTRQTVEALYGPEALYRNEEGKSLRIYTTLDPRLQRMAEQAVRDGVAGLADRNATNGALVAIDPKTGHILAMVGSADFNNEEIDGQVNVALRCRQPGSSIKPFTYLTAFEQGWTPATLLWDLETEFPDGAGRPPYVPVNYDERYHGPMLVRDALANSYNVPAVETLQFVGVDGLLEMAGRLGVNSLVHPELYCPDYPYEYPPTYGLALTLGGGEVKLLEMTGGFAVLANNGERLPPTPILRIEDSEGNVLEDNSAREGEQVVSPQHAYLITDILSDNPARCRAFSCPSILELSRPAAAKSGTTNDFRDAWTIGYTPDLVVGVWVGNSDNSSMINLPGAAGAGPIWHGFMESAHEGLPVRDFVRPPGVVEYEICANSGARPSEYCPERKVEVFVDGQPPLGEDHDWYQMVKIDNFTRLRANELCQDQVVEELMVVIDDERGREWAQAHPEYFDGLPLAPTEFCTDATDRPELAITQPGEGGQVHGMVQVFGTVQVPDFDHYEVLYGVGDDPIGWGFVSGPHKTQVRDGLLTEWDTNHLADGAYTLRVNAFNKDMRSVEVRVHVNVFHPTKEPSPTPVPTETPSPVPTLTPTGTPVPTMPVPTTLVPPTSPPPTASPPPTVPPTSPPTQKPTATPTPLPTTPPTATPAPPPTFTPLPTATPTPLPTAPPPTSTPEPTFTPKPTEAPPTNTPEPPTATPSADLGTDWQFALLDLHGLQPYQPVLGARPVTRDGQAHDIRIRVHSYDQIVRPWRDMWWNIEFDLLREDIARDPLRRGIDAV